MKITRVSVEELFYTYTYVIDINTDNPVSIIHAPNGYGKTTVFKLIRDTFNLNITGLLKIPFKHFSIELNNGTLIFITKNEDDDNSKYATFMEISISGDNINSQKLSLFSDDLQHLFEDAHYRNERIKAKIINQNVDLIDEFKRIRERIEVHFIETSRLYVQTSYERDFCLIDFDTRIGTIARNDSSHRNPHSTMEANERIIQCAYNLRYKINQIKPCRGGYHPPAKNQIKRLPRKHVVRRIGRGTTRFAAVEGACVTVLFC